MGAHLSKQELFIRACRQVHPEALYMGVGGTYDVLQDMLSVRQKRGKI